MGRASVQSISSRNVTVNKQENYFSHYSCYIASESAAITFRVRCERDGVGVWQGSN